MESGVFGVAAGFLTACTSSSVCISEVTGLAVIRSGFSIKYVPIKTYKRMGKSKIKLIQDGIRFLNIILRIAVFFAPLRVFVPISTLFFSLGLRTDVFEYSEEERRSERRDGRAI